MSAAPLHADNAAQAEYWNSVAGRRWTDRQEEQDLVLRPVSDRLIAAADAKPGQRIIDIGCGCGDTTIDFAARVMPGGEVLGLDISEPMLARARERAPSGLPARFVLADATVHDFEPEWADLAVSRFGVMFFADPARSFANLRRGLKPGARLAFACWREARQNPWMMIPLREAKKHAPPLPETNPEDPGPFAFADDARVRRVLSNAGFADIVATPVDLDLDLAIGRGAGRRRRRRARDRTDQPHPRRPARSRSRRRGDGHQEGAGRARQGRQHSARGRDLDRHGDQSGRVRLSGRLPRPQKRPHGETRLARAISVLGPDRASPPSPASSVHAILAGRALQMAGAGGDIVAAA